ncbi:phosphate regulon sensor histidine kinase PhoR [Psychrobacter sp.]|uniref:phosphate regulon sensor histidine kinase PhoR n=1 Tax=Psychrobacter sp. TaxID=56811 RepID=UPI00264753B4|nr:phosphate regulon sensor histidine kinase PhoR [Psychrobacter sp.]MDN6275351.1 phosphate regulon sensor histidine kinase PhoR [Psychrobacter sp.]MDN6307713.1 phosphate regulon sensor histidine kinase PhoR [Psychrobacter sp.]
MMPSQDIQQVNSEPVFQQTSDDQLKKIRSALRALRDAVVLLNEHGGLEWWNKSAEDLLCLKPSDKSNSIFDFISAREFRQYYEETTIPNDGVYIESWRAPKRNLKCELTPFGDEKLLIIYDVTRLQHLEKMRRDFVANVSHELRTPLTVMMGYLENFSDQPDMPPHWKRGFELMTQQTTRMNRVVSDLLLLSRIEIEEAHELNYIDVTRLLTHIYDDAQAYNQEYGHNIHLEIDTYDGLYGSEMYLTSALSNLVINAIKYTPKGGNITINWSKTAKGCRFAVEDDGIGIAPKHIARLTERFYRIDKGRSRSTGGTGLGLAIVKHVLYQHEAELQIESVEGKGSIFSAVFPPSYIRSTAIS